MSALTTTHTLAHQPAQTMETGKSGNFKLTHLLFLLLGKKTLLTLHWSFKYHFHYQVILGNAGLMCQ